MHNWVANENINCAAVQSDINWTFSYGKYKINLTIYNTYW